MSDMESQSVDLSDKCFDKCFDKLAYKIVPIESVGTAAYTH